MTKFLALSIWGLLSALGSSAATGAALRLKSKRSAVVFASSTLVWGTAGVWALGMHRNISK